MSASSSFIAKNRAGILGVSRLAQTIFLMACSADPWRTADGLRFGTSPVSRQTNEALRPSDGKPFLDRHYPASSVPLTLSDTQTSHRPFRRCWRRDLHSSRASPNYPDRLLCMPCSIPRWTGSGASVGFFPLRTAFPVS